MSAIIRICSFIALCSLLACQLGRVVDASSSHQQQQHGSKKSLSSWVQSYKEPKSAGEQQQQQGAGHKSEAATAMPPDEEEEEELSCTIKVQKVEKHMGKCIRLRGGSMACQTNTYLDPVNADCMFLE